MIKRRIFNFSSELGGSLHRGLVLRQQVNLHAGGLDVFGHVDYFLQSGDTKRHVFGRHSGEMEGVERHLRGGLSDGLRTNGANHLAWV